MSIYDQLARQVEALRKENTHLRRELEDNTNQLSKLENETSNMKEVMKQLQRKLKQEAHTLTSTGRSDKLTQHKGSLMDLADYSELECQADVLRLPSDCLAAEVSEGEDSACRRRDVSPIHAAAHPGWSVCGESMATHLLEGIIPRAGANGGSPVTSQDWEDIFKGRSSLLGEPEEEEQARYWCYSQLRGLSRQLIDFPGIDTTSSFERPEPEITLHSSIPGTGEDAYKVEALFWLLSLLAMRDREEVSCTLLALSSCRDICMAMRRSGCVPLLVQILHVEAAPEGAVPKVWGRCSRQARSRISAALHNIVYAQPDEGQARREKRVLHALEQIRAHCDSGWDWIETSLGDPTPGAPPDPVEPQICQATCVVMKLSFVEEYRQAMNELGALHAIAELMQLDCEMYGTPTPSPNMLLRRYAGMALTNLTFRDVVNKATLCSKKECLRAMVAQLSGQCEDLHQVVSSILRNLSWRADINSKVILKDVGSVSALMTCAMQATKESTLKSLLSALWNLSAHSTENKLTICSAHGALGFLVSTLTYKCQNNSLVIIESGGGILRNVSSLIATREDYRQVLRDHNCLQTLLQHLRSHSLTIVSNACGTLWNLSARSAKDQELLWDLGAVGMLRNLVHSKHKMIAMGSAAALRNLITNRPHKYKEAAVISPGSCTPSLYMRKQKALEAELHANHLAEISDSTDNESPKHTSIKRPLRHSENPAKDYASDSGCFDDDETTNFSSSLDTGSFSMLSIFLNNSNILHNQPCKTELEPEQDMDPQKDNDKKSSASIGPVPNVAEKHKKMITCSLVKINKLVDDVSMQISSEDSFSLSSEDNFVEWQCRPDVLHEARAKSCSPCRQSDTGSSKSRENLSKAHAHLYVKTAYKGLSTEGVNCSSADDDFCSNKDQIRASVRSATVQKRPCNLDLKVDYYRDLEQGARHNRGGRKQMQEPPQHAPMTVTPTVSSEAAVITAKSPPSYEQIPFIQNFSKFGVGMTPISVQAAQAITQQVWMPIVPTSGFMSKFSTINCSLSPTELQVETLQKYSVENTPICFYRCSSLSSLSSGEGALEKQSPDENELESDSSLESIEVEECDRIPRKKEGETLEDPSKKARPDQKTSVNRNGPLIQPIQAPSATKREKALLGKVSPERPVDTAPSSSSENYFLETPLVMSRCSSVSSLGSFESLTIASSGQSDSFSEISSGTISPSDLPDSPGQTMPPSRSKTPCSVDPGVQVTPVGGCGGQEECRKQKSVEISDFREKFSLPVDFDPMIPYFTVEKPIENFSCASSLSALPLHDHYIQKDVELKLMPLHHHRDNTMSNHMGRDEAEYGQPSGMHVDSPAERSSDCNSEDDIEILKECINSAMPSRLKNATHFHKSHLHPPVYMVPSHNSEMLSAERAGMSEKYFYLDNTYFNDSWKLEDWELKEPKQMKRAIKKVMETRAAISQIRRQNKSPNSISQNHEQVHLQNSMQLDQCITKQSTENQNALCIEMSQSSLYVDCTNMKVEGKISSLGKKGDGNVLNNSAANVDQGASTQSKHISVASQIKPGNLIMDETPPFCSLSSSVSSLSDVAFQDHCDKSQQTWNKNRHLIMADSICDGAKLLNLQGITSATPKKRWQRTPKNERKRKPKSHALKSPEVESEDKATNGDSDLDSVEWRAIQEGAGIVVARLQAASEAREPSSESESMLSITSSVSAGSSLHPKPRRGIRKNNDKDHSNKVNKMSEDRNLRTQIDFSQQKPVTNLPMDFRGRAVTHMPKKEGITLQKQTTKTISPKVETSIKSLNIDLTQQRSRSVNRLGHLNDASQMSVSERSATPPARIPKSSSQSSTALKQSQKKQTTSQIRKPVQKKGTKTANCQADQRGNMSASPDEKPGHNNYPAERKTHKSPVRIPFMQKPRRVPSTTNTLPPLVTNKPSCVSIKNKDLSGPQTRHASHLKKVHLTTGYSNSNNIDQNCLVRQLTFIKESASDLRHGVPCSQSMPTSQSASHQEEVQERRQGQSKSQRQEQRPLGKSSTLFRASSNDRNLTTKHPARRTSSVSPCRQSNRLGNQQRKSQIFNQPSSFPSLTSLNSTTNSSGAEKNQKGPKERQQQHPGSQISGGMTWRRIKDYNVPQMPSVWSNPGQKQVLPQVPGKLPTIPMPSGKASDAIVQTDDFTANDANSSASPTNEKAPVIKEEETKISTDPASNTDMQDARGFDNSFKSHNSASSSQSVEGHDLSAEDISQGLPSKAVRVIPYSYIPSSLACGLQNTQMQATKLSGALGEPLEA